MNWTNSVQYISMTDTLISMKIKPFSVSTKKGPALIWNFIASSHRLKRRGVQTHI